MRSCARLMGLSKQPFPLQLSLLSRFESSLYYVLRRRESAQRRRIIAQHFSAGARVKQPHSPRSGRMKIAQQFTAGSAPNQDNKSVKRTADTETPSGSEGMRPLMMSLESGRYRSRFCNSVVRYTDSVLRRTRFPAINRWAIFVRPLSRTLEEGRLARAECRFVNSPWGLAHA
jgi:hypothetical protein